MSHPAIVHHRVRRARLRKPSYDEPEMAQKSFEEKYRESYFSAEKYQRFWSPPQLNEPLVLSYE
jgi:hypothetical protein